jgi:predicted O-methyltransferase YrrM
MTAVANIETSRIAIAPPLRISPCPREMDREYCDHNQAEITLPEHAEIALATIESEAWEVHNTDWNYYSNAIRREVVAVFLESIAATPPGPIDFLEIGSACGLSMSLVGTLLKNMNRLGSLVSIDPYFDDGYIEGEGSPMRIIQRVRINAGTLPKARELYSRLGLNVEHLRAPSGPGLKQLVLNDRRFDLIYVDGSHERLNPLIDFGVASLLLRPGGIILVDDHRWRDVTPVKLLCDAHAERIAQCWKVAAYRLPIENRISSAWR